MSKIKILSLENFKFFYGVNEFNFNGKNILLYGENGSGKSSIYWALYTLLQSSNKNISKIKTYFNHREKSNLLNKFINDTDVGKVSIKLMDGTEYTISYDDNEINTIENVKLKEANIASDFINYKLLSKLYDFKHSARIDLFELFYSDIFDYMIFSDSKTYSQVWKELLKYEETAPKKNTYSYLRFTQLITSFNTKLKTFLETIIADINDILENNFYQGLTVEYRYIDLKYDDGHPRRKYRQLVFPKIVITLTYEHESITVQNKAIHKPHTFLNEAKLTAIALSIRLSILRTRVVSEGILKILVLDDLLVSLDMSNREIVLNMLINDSYLQDYQIIMLTHDRAFFNMARQKFESKQKEKWAFFEMYVNDKEKFDKPLILPSRNYFEYAEYYLIKHDYPTCANYLRKEAERLLKDLVCHKDLSCQEQKNLQTLIDKAKSKGSLKDKEKVLEQVKNIIGFDSFQKFIDFDMTYISGIDNKKTIGEIKTQLRKIREYPNKEIEGLNETLEMLENFKRIILNPQSHDDTTVPLYKKELNDAKDTIEILKNSIENI